jgi:class 3 adenylate cyclase/type II secretory pathway predicted ATPase ExeA
VALAAAFGLDQEARQRFFAAARPQPALTTVSVSPGPQPELAPPGRDPEQAGPGEQTDDIQVFLIADVRGYSTYTDAHYDQDAAQLSLRFAALARAAVQSHGGQVLEVRGDEVLAVFASARAALRAASAFQQQVEHASRTTPEQPVRCGIGVEAGEAIPVPGGYRGQAINLAARLCAAAGPGGCGRRDGDRSGPGGARLPGSGISVPESLLSRRITQVLAAEQPPLPEEPEASTPQPEPILPAPGKHESPAGKAVGNYLSAQPRFRLVARETEMARLLAALDRVQEGTGRLVVVVGEPGVGKTRLAQEVLLAAQQRGFVGITGRCYAPQETTPYYPFLEALARAYAAAPLTLRTALPQQWPDVARLIPDHSRAVPVASVAHPASGSAEDQQRLFWQVTRFLQALAEERSLALLLDDLHWMDGASLELLLHLVRTTRESPILLLGTYRDSEVPMSHPLAEGLRDLGRAQLVERIELHPLPREGTAALLLATLEEGEVSEAVTDVIYGPTEGNAFFVQEVLQALVERGDITLQSGCWQPRAGAAIVVPESVRGAVLERVGRLSPTAQEILGVASVLEQTFRFDDLLSTLSLVSQTPGALTVGSHGAVSTSTTTEQETRLEAALDEAVRVRVLREVGGEGYTFSHVLAQRALYEQLSARRRQRVHRAVAESLEHVAEPERIRRVSDLAYHFLQADEPARALPYILQAGEQAQAVYAHPAAERQFRTALDLARQVGDPEAGAEDRDRAGVVRPGTLCRSHLGAGGGGHRGGASWRPHSSGAPHLAAELRRWRRESWGWGNDPPSSLDRDHRSPGSQSRAGVALPRSRPLLLRERAICGRAGCGGARAAGRPGGR